MQLPRCFRSQILAVFFLSLICLVSGCTSASKKATVEEMDPRIRALATAMQTRLVIADQVAWAKYQNNAPIFDPDRERVVIARAVSLAQQSGVNEGMAERFFSAQILASRTRQEECIHLWKRGNPLPSWGPVDLKQQIRPVLDQLTVDLIAGLNDFPDSPAARQSLADILIAAGNSRKVADAATRF